MKLKHHEKRSETIYQIEMVSITCFFLNKLETMYYLLDSWLIQFSYVK